MLVTLPKALLDPAGGGCGMENFLTLESLSLLKAWLLPMTGLPLRLLGQGLPEIESASWVRRP